MSKQSYTPRRASKRWLDGDCPDGVLAIFDNPKYADRFTVFYRAPVSGDSFANMWLGYRAMSANPYDAQGVGIYGESQAYQVAAFRYRNRHKAAKWSTLPDKVRECVLCDLSETGVQP